jgi:hypothetical protein
MRDQNSGQFCKLKVVKLVLQESLNIQQTQASPDIIHGSKLIQQNFC